MRYHTTLVLKERLPKPVSSPCLKQTVKAYTHIQLTHRETARVCAQACLSLQPYGLQPTGLLCP